MRANDPNVPRRARSCRTIWLLAASLLIGSPLFAGTPRWMLVYYRQYGNVVNAGNHTIESHLFREDGTKGATVGMTNLYNPGIPIFGQADATGWHRITTLESAGAYDLRVYMPNVATDQTPSFYHYNAASGAFYSFETQWLYVTDDAAVNAYPQTPVYHYDRVDGLNDAQHNEPPGTNSDANSLVTWKDYQAQTFVVPPGINRIVSVQAFVIRNYLTHFQYRATIHEGGPTGPLVGTAATSRCLVAVEFFPVLANWPIDAVRVTPGQTYALKLTPVLNAGCAEDINTPGMNAYATLSDNYAGGMLYNGPTPVPGRDLLAIIVGVGKDIPPLDPAVINVAPAGLARQVEYRQNVVPSDSLTLSNTGGAPLDYAISGVPSWLTVTPTSGRLDPTQSRAIAVGYATDGLASGLHAANLVIADPMAANSPFVVPVSVTVSVPSFAPVDFDQDGDVDQEDFGRFQACYTAEGVPQNEPACAGARLDADSDVDPADFDIFLLRCLTGPGTDAIPTCNQ